MTKIHPLPLLLSSALTHACAYAALNLIVRLRLGNAPQNGFRLTWKTAALTLLYNVIILSMGPAPILWIALPLADVDLWIRKLPRELILIMVAAALLHSVRSWGALFITIFTALLWFGINRAIGKRLIAPMDVAYLACLQLVSGGTRAIRLIPVFLILWGLFGLGIKKAGKPLERIPLAPIALLALALNSIIPLTW